MWISTDPHPDLVRFDASKSRPIDTESGWKRYLDSTSTAGRIIFGLKFSGGVVSAWAILRALNYLDQVGVL